MKKIRITKEFKFEMAHALHGHDGLCKHIHGHSYKLFVTVIGSPISDIYSPKYGMLIDFSDLKRIVKDEIVDKLDHALMVNSLTSQKDIEGALTGVLPLRIVSVPYQTTCENMVVDFADRIKPELPKGVSLHSIKLHETATSYAEWFASDNE
ncbi:MAG: 6-carboxytetrahydropterin synthase [Ichthyobacteriaceae bacterium]|nr:6-carboxytetrahydropterin synthase [Ichthyobacteriaceae bacterium]